MKLPPYLLKLISMCFALFCRCILTHNTLISLRYSSGIELLTVIITILETIDWTFILDFITTTAKVLYFLSNFQGLKIQQMNSTSPLHQPGYHQ
ncbi:hypothetical protein MtrunA17_Chr5g0409481 [Medicago truncatula]|uniref:Uncharacterized protein n=1 Tax=Medicago truncatula TaxID=3880 RepID=A0A396HQ23_MEDTR|nr:hypothetical protein MtrunA17_Chr5g0409481 [Medicago truncatula]